MASVPIDLIDELLRLAEQRRSLEKKLQVMSTSEVKEWRVGLAAQQCREFRETRVDYLFTDDDDFLYDNTASICYYLPQRWLRWQDNTIPRIAQSIYEEEHFEAMPILADALEEAGCTTEEILAHLRSSEPHDCDCWVLKLLLRNN